MLGIRSVSLGRRFLRSVRCLSLALAPSRNWLRRGFGPLPVALQLVWVGLSAVPGGSLGLFAVRSAARFPFDLGLSRVHPFGLFPRSASPPSFPTLFKFHVLFNGLWAPWGLAGLLLLCVLRFPLVRASVCFCV